MRIIRKFVLLKLALTILFLIFGVTTYAQDTLRLSFQTSNGSISSEHGREIEFFTEGKTVLKANIISIIASNGNLSSNRVQAEYRLITIRKVLERMGISYANIATQLYMPDSESSKPEVLVDFKFAGKKGKKDLKKTSVVQISEVNYSGKPIEKKVEEPTPNPERNEVVLNPESFKKDQKVRLPNLLFETSTHFFLPGSDGVLAELSKIMKSKTSLKIQLQGHICCRLGGTDGLDPVTNKFNLSEERAKAVYLYLISQGIDKNRMSYKGFGSRNKLFPEERSQAEMQLNRRVEVLVLED